MSAYFPPPVSGGSAGGGKTPLGPPAPNLFGASGQATAKGATTKAPPTKTIQVRAHTRTIPMKPPKGEAPLTQSVSPATKPSTAVRFKPNFPGEPVAGYSAGSPFTKAGKAASPFKSVDAMLAPPVAKGLPGAARAPRPYYTDAHTVAHGAGPTGDEASQLNAANLATAKAIERATYGTPGYIVRSLIPGGLDQGGTTSVAKAIERGVSAASLALPGGGVGEAAGILGLGLRGLRGLRAAEDVAPFTREVVHVTTPQAAAAIRKGGFSVKATGGIGGSDYGPGIHLADKASDAGAFWRNQLETRGEKGVVPTEIIQGRVSLRRPFEYDYRKYNLRGDPIGRVSPREALMQQAPQAVKTFDAAVARGVPENRALSLAVKKAGYDGLVISHPNGDEIVAFHPRSVSLSPTAAHASAEAAAVRRAMPGAKITRGRQEAGYSAERAQRVAAARVHLENPALTPAERVGKAKGELAGELPKINFQGFSELNHESLQALQTHILDHPNLMPFQKIRASDALVNALAGKVPTRSEITLLEHVFGKDTAAGLAGIAGHPLRDRILSALNIPRSLMASFDLSAPFRQGLVVSTRHPAIFFRNFGSMVKAFGSERVYQGILDGIEARPTYPLMIEAKLPITKLASDVGGREEQFASDYAEKLTGGKYGPVRASGRAYTGFLDKTRADVFDHLISRAQGQGINVQDQEFLRSLGRYIGSATGRGDLGHFQEAGKVLNTFFFSPRLLASRLNFLNPVYYARLDPFARKEALRSALQLAGTLSTLLAIASRIPGAKVVTDPRNPDWGKIRVGNTRLDFGGGFQQPLRLLAQLGTGVAISSTTGKKLALTAGGFGQPTRLDIALRFFEGKESPIASLVTDWLRGSNQVGQPFSYQSALAQRMTPLLGQDAYDLYKQQHGGMNGLAAAFAGYGVGSVGIGLQTYGPAVPLPTSAPPDTGYFGAPTSSSGGSGYFDAPSSSGGGSGYFGP